MLIMEKIKKIQITQKENDLRYIGFHPPQETTTVNIFAYSSLLFCVCMCKCDHTTVDNLFFNISVLQGQLICLFVIILMATYYSIIHIY